ncbi:MAG: FecR domain-containing protein [Spirochaetes bacterium]|nr:FecR domain-containing protein [Spirochaetota bacterium]
MRRIVFAIGLVLATIAGCTSDQADEYAMIMFMMGDVTKNNASVSIGDLVNQSDVIATGSGAFCDIRIGGSVVRIKEKSRVVFSSLVHSGIAENTTLGLDVGKMLCKPKRLMKTEKFMVKTPTAVAAVRGTQFIVEADLQETTRIKVFTGKLKIARRIEQLEGSVDKILDIASVLEEQEKVIITKREVDRAERVVQDILKEETAKGEGKAIEAAIHRARSSIVVGEDDIQRFNPEDFAKEKDEIIRVRERPREVIRQIAKVIQQEKEMPRRFGRLLVTRYEVYYIQEGKVLWEGRVQNPPLRKNDKLYVASENYVFCASSDGPIMWRINMQNDGKLEIRDNKLVVFSQGNENLVDLDTGRQL